MDAAVSLFWIAVVAVIAPLLAALVPRSLVPETVLLLAFGVVIGPHVLGIATTGEAVEAFRELGLAMLFLLAGYEIELKELTGRGGRRALVTWVCGFLLALAFVALLGLAGLVTAELAVAIALVSTALGVLLPILRGRRAAQHALRRHPPQPRRVRRARPGRRDGRPARLPRGAEVGAGAGRSSPRWRSA